MKPQDLQKTQVQKNLNFVSSVFTRLILLSLIYNAQVQASSLGVKCPPRKQIKSCMQVEDTNDSYIKWKLRQLSKGKRIWVA